MSIPSSVKLVGVIDSWPTLIRYTTTATTATTAAFPIQLRLDLIPAEQRTEALDHLAQYPEEVQVTWPAYELSEALVPKRQAYLQEAAEAGFTVLLDYPHDTHITSLAQHIHADQRIVCAKVETTDSDTLNQTLASASEVEALLYQITATAVSHAEGLAMMHWLQQQQRNDVVAFDASIAGRWTQVLAPYLGAPVVWGVLDDSPQHNLLPMARLKNDFGFPALRPVNTIYGIIGTGVAGSLAPRAHNHGYAKVGIEALYLPFPVQDFAEFWNTVMTAPHWQAMGLPLKGLTVVAPFKQELVQLAAGICHPLVEVVQAGNLVVQHKGQWLASTTESTEIMWALQTHGRTPYGLKVAVIGCGGTGHAIAAALKIGGAKVTLVNRSLPKGQQTAERLGVPFVPLADFEPGNYQAIIHATPVGKKGQEAAYDVSKTAADTVIIDMVYRRDQDTALIQQAEALGRVAVPGRHILAASVSNQFLGMTAQEVPAETLQAVLSNKVEVQTA